MSLIQDITDQLDSIEQYGIVKQIHGHFYYTEKLENFFNLNKDISTVQAKEELMPLTLPTRLQKEKVETYVGDIVEFDEQNKVIKSVAERKSLLSRPKVANVDQAIVVVAAEEPPLEPEYLDRILCHAGLTLPLKSIICVTKIDIEPLPPIVDLYKSLGYTVVSISNHTKQGIDELKNILLDNTSVLAGQSGVGKSSLLNSLFPEFDLKVGEVSAKSLRGTHTTRHTQIFDQLFDNKLFHVLDTPGFSRLDAQFIPSEIANPKSFPEIGNRKQDCQFSDCKHLDEEGCAVLFSETRKASYSKLMSEADKYEKEQAKTFTKERRESTKSDSDTLIPKLKSSLRATSRKKRKQDFDY